MLEYDIENTINTIKENGVREIYIINKIGEIQCKNNNNENSVARKRWKILARAIKQQSMLSPIDVAVNSSCTAAIEDNVECNEEDVLSSSVRRFTTFDLVQQNHISTSKMDKANLFGCSADWYLYKLSVSNLEYFVNIHHINRPVTASDLMGFNNTGNVCVWPSEEALAYYCLTELAAFQEKFVLELGGGMTCLAGLLIAKYGKPHSVHLTDGNALSVENVKRTCRLNDVSSCYIKCSVLKWQDFLVNCRRNLEKFDYILCADCLFFDEVRMALVETIWYFLSETGTALVMAPKRATTLDTFVQCAEERGFRCDIVHHYNDMIWQRHLELKLKSKVYDEDLHYPILIKLTKF